MEKYNIPGITSFSFPEVIRCPEGNQLDLLRISGPDLRIIQEVAAMLPADLPGLFLPHYRGDGSLQFSGDISGR